MKPINCYGLIWQRILGTLWKIQSGRFILFRLPLTMSSPLDLVVYFIAYMSMQDRTPGAIRTYVSGLSYMYKIHGLWDVTKFYIVTKMLENGSKTDSETRHTSHHNIVKNPINPTGTREGLRFICLGRLSA